MLFRSLPTVLKTSVLGVTAVLGLGFAIGLAACGGDDEDARDMSHCAATTCSSAQVFNAKTCQCDAIDMANADH